VAGINAALKVKNETALVLDRTEAYTAILIDDLISKGTNEPYRMFTSRAEFRLHLRIDNADRRLTPHGRRVGLINDAAWTDFLAKQQRLAAMKELLQSSKLTSEMVLKIAACGSAQTPDDQRPATDDLNGCTGQTFAQILKRPEITIEHLSPILQELDQALFQVEESSPDLRESAADLPSSLRNELKSVETEIKYEGYLQQQQRAIERLKKAERRSIPEWFDYRSVSGLSREMQEKLVKIRPRTIGHASRIPGVTPAAVSLVNVYIEIQARRREQAAAI
jgi:tRNA uridine 5-carboxymethylaminomethyl modification enzyme